MAKNDPINSGPEKKKKPKRGNELSRREFLFWLGPIIASMSGLYAFGHIYRKNLLPSFAKSNTAKQSKGNKERKKDQLLLAGQYIVPGMVLNKTSRYLPETKTIQNVQIIHFYSKQLYKYCDPIKVPEEVGLEDWKKRLGEGAYFAKGKSGNTFEYLSLKNLFAVKNILEKAPNELPASIEILSNAFATTYVGCNKYNWRLYDLLLKYFALSTYGPSEAWFLFKNKTLLVDLTHAKIPKKNAWMLSKPEFENRVKYIKDNKTVFIKKLQNRIQNMVGTG